MVKLTLVGRLSDGLPLAQTPMYLNEENEASSFYRRKGELVMKEITRGALSNPRMSILIDHHCFHYLIGGGVCYITLCDSSYPRKLAFHYLQDLRKEFEKMDVKLVESVSKPYAFTRFDYVIGSIRKKYLDTRTQANLSRMNSDRRRDLDIVTEDFSNIISNRQRSGTEARTPTAILQMDSADQQLDVATKESLDCRINRASPRHEQVIALKWTPITMIVIVVALLLWTSIVVEDAAW